MEFYANFSNVEINTNSRISPSESDSSNSTGTTKPRHVVNARERCRTQRYVESSYYYCGYIWINYKIASFSSVNSAFNTLRTLIPTEPYDRKLSKIEILRLAKSYIAHLDAVILTGKLLHTNLNIYSRDAN